MKHSWIKFLDEVASIIEAEEEHDDMLFFRGHSDTWNLLPSLLRIDNNLKRIYTVEARIYYDFISNGGALLGATNKKSWEILFIMQHHGLPTRLLDWTENFATALFFALSEPKPNNPEIWILNPFKLNAKSSNIGECIVNPDIDFGHNYYQTFINDNNKLKNELPIAMYPIRNNNRLINQKGLFTLHGKSLDPIEKLASDCLHKIPIPADCISDAQKFLKLAGINNFSIYNDLDSLARYIKSRNP